MSTEDTMDLPIEVIGGLVTNIAPSDLPHGASPDCQDMQFQIGSGKTRPGITSLYALAGNPTVNSLATYETLTEIPRFVSLDSLGLLRKDGIPGGALVPIYNGIPPNSFFKSCSLFGRQYFGFSDGQNGKDIPRQYDDANLDRISQSGPGAAPSAMDEVQSFTPSASPAGFIPQNDAILAAPNGLILQASGLVQLTNNGALPLNPNLLPGDAVSVTGAGNAAYNINYVVVSIAGLIAILNPTTVIPAGTPASGGGTLQTNIVAVAVGVGIPGYLTSAPFGYNLTETGATDGFYNGTWQVRFAQAFTFNVYIPNSAAHAASGGGTAVISGNIPAGKHQISVIFVTRNGYYTKPAPPTSWISGGSKRVLVTNIPIGPPNVIARVLCFTGVNGASFYHLGPTGITINFSNMYIADNVTTSTFVDFTDATLLLGTLDDPLFNQIVLPPVAGVIDYSDRLFAWGEQNNVQAFLNLSFDGGFSNPGTLPNFPLGWVQDAVFSPGGASALAQAQTAVFGDAYAIFGNGATATRGKITQGAAVDSLGNPILSPNTAYTVRARIAVLAAVAGTVHINLQSTSLGITTPGMAVPFNLPGLGGNYLLVSASLTNGLAAIPADLVLQLYVDGTPNNTAIFLIDEIEIFPTNAQFNNSNLRASFGQLNTQGQESYDSETGLLQYSLNDGQSIRTCFKIRDKLYIVKEHSFGVTQDDGIDEPDQWRVQDISKEVGTPSVNGVGIGEDWVVIAHRTGLYIYWGGNLEKISQEIQPTWDSINWQYGNNIAVTVDTRRRRILICAPFGAAQILPNKTLVLDYHDVGSDAAAIASNPPIHLTYTGAKRAFDRARKWCPWTISANCVAQIELSNGQTSVVFGSNDGTGDINQLDDTGTIFTDNGAQIPSYYTTSFLPDRESKQGLQLSQHRILFDYLTSYIQGVGNVGLTVFLDTFSNAIALNPQALANPAVKDLEVGVNQTIERMAVKWSNGGVAGNFFDLQNQILNVRTDPWAVVRGNN